MNRLGLWSCLLAVAIGTAILFPSIKAGWVRQQAISKAIQDGLPRIEIQSRFFPAESQTSSGHGYWIRKRERQEGRK